ncbi:proton-coupled folate transporter-like [Amphiura filiformis]|uniref:proton-coupled folate transporter-like n=1 Tax=Amphiura filiformis TaxID=82378 RepID=UPI003B2179E7
MATAKETSLFIPQLTMFLLFFGFSVILTATQLMVLNKTCLSNGYDRDVCEHMHQHPDVEDKVQTKAARFTFAVPILAFIPAAFMTLVLGPLSDIYGRKKILLIPVITGAISALGMLIQSQQLDLSPVLIYGACSFIGFGGGLGTFVSTLISYVTDSTLPEHRTERLSMLLPFLALGQTVGTLCSGILWEQTGAPVMFILAFLGNIIIIISLLFLEESSRKEDDNKDHGHALSVTGLFKSATAGWRVVSAPRQNGRRRKLLMLLIVGPAAIFFNAGDVSVVSLSTRRPPFQWTPSTLSYFSASKMVAQVLGTALLVPLYNKITGSKTIQGDLSVMYVCFSTAALQCLVMIVATSSSHLLIVPFLFASIGAVGPVTRSLASKLVKPSEIGALNGFVSFLNNMAAAVGSSLTVSLYTNTVHTFPAAAFLAIMFVLIGSFIIVLVLKRDYREFPAETDDGKKAD